MTSIFETALGSEEFAKLHPMMQRRFGVGLDSGEACIGRGVMHAVRHGPWWTIPFLRLGGMRNILVPDNDDDVPFTIANYPYVDPFGRETITFVREYTVHRHDPKRARTRRFDATMIAVDGRVVDYLGTHQHLAVDLDLEVDERGGLILRSDAQRIHEGPISFNFPMQFSGRAELREYYHDADDCFHVELAVTNPRFGFLFGYRGTFTCEWVDATHAPPELRPRRHQIKT